MLDAIILKNVRTHNLKGIDVAIPHRSLTVITGVSGSGKSSLAFDTLYAEGRRRYVESLSAYARQFLERIEKPNIEFVSGILPAIAIESKNVISNARSTVGTQTELYDYLRLLFARIGTTYCKECGEPVALDTAESIARTIIQDFGTKEIMIAFPVLFGEKSKRWAKESVDELRRQGFSQFIVSEKEVDFEMLRGQIETGISQILVILDRVRISAENERRLVDSLESAFKFGNGQLSVLCRLGEDFEERHFSNRFHCASCNLDYRKPDPNMFSFNSPLGACPACQGFGRVVTIDWNLVLPNPKLSLEEGAIEPWTKPSCGWERRQMKKFCLKRKIPLDKPFHKLNKEHRQWILHGGKGGDYFSVQDFFDYLEKKTYKMHVRVFLSKYRGYIPCVTCKESRLKSEALLVRVNGKNISELCQITLGKLKEFFDALNLNRHDEVVAAPVLSEVKNRLSFLVEVGLGYLTLSRLSRTLSGGESQRIRLAASLGSQLVDTLYVLDEPSVGLHERDHLLVIRLLQKLKNLGNTVVVVEHDREMIESSDLVIDIGPLGGERGGEIVFSGTFEELIRAKNSHTARFFRNELKIERTFKVKNFGKRTGKSISIQNASEHNLKHISVEIPLEGLTVITGVSGSGKSTLMYDVLYANYLKWRGRAVQDVGQVGSIEGFEAVEDMLMIDQSPIGRTPRSNPVTYMKAFDEIRKIYSETREAKRNGFTPGHFSFNGAHGRCEKCEGAGMQKIEMHFLADIYIICETCGGTRYQSHVLEVRYKDKNIHEVLSMTVGEALHFFEDRPRACAPLAILTEVGLGHLRLGQPASTLSGGEAQRLKLASELVHGGDSWVTKPLFYLFDEPTTGLHYYDIQSLIRSFERLLERGHAVCLIEHNMEVIKCADYVIDLGPEGGEAGGELLYAGTLQGLLEIDRSQTAQALQRYRKELCSSGR